MNCKECGRRWSWPNLRYCSGHMPGRTAIDHENLSHSCVERQSFRCPFVFGNTKKTFGIFTIHNKRQTRSVTKASLESVVIARLSFARDVAGHLTVVGADIRMRSASRSADWTRGGDRTPNAQYILTRLKATAKENRSKSNTIKTRACNFTQQQLSANNCCGHQQAAALHGVNAYVRTTRPPRRASRRYRLSILVKRGLFYRECIQRVQG